MRAAGVNASTPWDLVNSPESYRAAIPLLCEWLEKTDDAIPKAAREKFREGVVRSLTVKEARGVAGPVLLREFHRPNVSSEYRWAVGNALEVVAGNGEFQGLVDIARDTRFGADRQMVVLALGRVKRPEAVDVLIPLLVDDDVAGHAAKALGKLRACAARGALKDCLAAHRRPWVRREAERALAKIDANHLS